MDRAKIGVLVLCLGCLQVGCGKSAETKNSAETGAPEKQAEKAGGQGRLAEKLDRNTALALLKERFPVPPYVNFNMSFLGVEIPSTIGAKMGGDSPEGDADVDFYRHMAIGGLLKQVECATKNPDFFEYCFVPAHPDVRPSPSGRPGWMWITFSRTRYGAVTGIIQEGPKAVAEVEFVLVPTDGWKRSAAIVELAAKTPERQWGARGWLQWRQIPRPAREVVVKNRCYFARYDDGWRFDSIH